MRVAGAILSGGEATRFAGAPKGLVEISPGAAIIAHVLEEMAASGLGEIIIVANDREPYRPFAREVVSDLRRGVGPLAGIESALTHFASSHDAVLFCPCDLPGITRREFRGLLSAFLDSAGPVVTAETDGFLWHPLCCVVRGAMLKEVRGAIDRGVRSVNALWRESGAVPVHFDDDSAFFNVNARDDLARWRLIDKRQA
jgi:molybdopterin-guanine dinucleotide biosynthesis protein A